MDAGNNGRKGRNGPRFLVLATGWKVMLFTKLVPGFESMFPVKLEAWRWEGQKFKMAFGGQKTKLIKGMLKEKKIQH